MSLFWHHKKHSNYKQITHTLATSLQTYSPIKSKKIDMISLNKIKKGAFLIASVSKKGSITLEAAMVIPLYLFFLLNLISLINFLSFQSKLETAMYQTAKEMAMWGYVYEKEEIKMPEIVLSEVYVRNQITKELGVQYLQKAPVKGGARGISLLRSRIMEDDKIDLKASYSMTTGMKIIPFPDMRVMSRCLVRAWTGYDNLLGNANREGNEDYVYVSSTSQVYHVTPNCTHLDLSVQGISKEEIAVAKNKEGSPYSSCQLCNVSEEDTLYITDFGECFHSDLECSALKRTIQAIPITQVAGKPPCSRCIGES